MSEQCLTVKESVDGKTVVIQGTHKALLMLRYLLTEVMKDGADKGAMGVSPTHGEIRVELMGERDPKHRMIILTKEMVFSSFVAAARRKEVRLIEDLASVGTILSKNARGVVVGALAKLAIQYAAIHLGQQAAGSFDFTDFINSTNEDLMKWIQESGQGYLVPMATGRN